jgi:Domain of unknown function (DUF4352)
VLCWAMLGGSAACGGQPAAGDLWDRPGQSTARDAHATVQATGGGAAFQGGGTIVFKPRTAMSLRLQARLGPLPGQLDVLEVNGVTYQRVTVGDKWARSPVAVPDPTWEGATDPRLLGQVTLAGVRAWHLRATRDGSPVEMWVRASDGYPLQVITHSDTGILFRFLFDRFNTGDRVVAPLAYELKPPARTVTGRVGDELAIDGARIGVLSSEDGAAADDPVVVPRAGNRFVVVEVSVENEGAEPLSTFFDWSLADSAGGTWAEALDVRDPAFTGGELEPGERAQGFLTYEVSATAAQLTLVVRLGGDRATFVLD